MINAAQIREILSLYGKHGWTLRRVLLSDALRTQISDQLETLFGAEAVFVTSEINALWFSRPSNGDGEAWEIRHLSETPFALVEVFEAGDDEEIRDERRAEIETELKEKVAQKKSPEKST